MQPLVAKYSQLLTIDSSPLQVDWVMTEEFSEGLTVLLDTLWSDTHPLVADIISLLRQNARVRVDWAGKYDIVPMDLLRHLTLELNTWCISVE